MTLKEKFENIDIVTYDSIDRQYYSNLDKEEVEEIVNIADDFAICFAEWCTKYRDKNRNVNGEMLHAKSKYDETYLTKELLEMYKNEQGL